MGMHLRHTQGYCASCDSVVPAEIIEESGRLIFKQYCPHCGESDAVIEHDAALYRHWESIRRPNRPPESHQTDPSRGCPLDCSLCANHRQKSCVALIEITRACDMACPV